MITCDGCGLRLHYNTRRTKTLLENDGQKDIGEEFHWHFCTNCFKKLVTFLKDSLRSFKATSIVTKDNE